MPKVSIWLTSYNHGSLLKDCIDSVLAQTYTDYELFIIDDCSNDGSIDTILSYKEKYPWIHVILHEKNEGSSAPYPYLSRLSGEYIAIIHGDDLWLPDKLEKQMKEFDADKDLLACFTAVSLISKDGTSPKGRKSVFYDHDMTRAGYLRTFYDSGNHLCHSSMVMRLDAYESCGLSLSGLSGLTDLYKWVRLCLKGSIRLIPEVLTRFRVYDDEKNESGESIGNLNRLSVEETFVYESYFEIPDTGLLLGVFPEAACYVKEEGCCIPFAVAKMMLLSERNSLKLCGLRKIYELMRSPKTALILDKYYGYNSRAFDTDKKAFDIFRNTPEDSFVRCGLYADFKEGFSENEYIGYKKYIPSTGTVVVSFDLRNFSKSEGILALRFDPDEGFLRKISLSYAKWEDGTNAVLTPANAITRQGSDYFLSGDPQYLIKVPSGLFILQIKMQVDPLPEDFLRENLSSTSKERKPKHGFINFFK